MIEYFSSSRIDNLSIFNMMLVVCLIRNICSKICYKLVNVGNEPVVKLLDICFSCTYSIFLSMVKLFPFDLLSIFDFT